MTRIMGRSSQVALLACVAITSCRQVDDGHAQPSAPPPVPGEGAVKLGTEQTEGPGDRADEPRFVEGAGSPLRPGPTIQIQPADLTSGIDKSAIRVGVNNLGAPVGAQALAALAQSIRLYEWPEMRDVPFTTTVQDVTGNMHASDGYRRADLAYVEVTPATPFADRWYAVVVTALPGNMARPRLSQHQRLPDGSLGARFTPGSHPTVSGIRVCDKGGGSSVVIVDFSERIKIGPDLASRLQMVDALQSKAMDTCVLDAPSTAAPSGGTTARFVRFTCQGLDMATSPVKITIDGAVSSPSGGSLETPGKGLGRAEHTLTNDRLESWDAGCRIMRP
jgi:hypothetical protein